MVTLLIGIAQLFAGPSLFAGGGFGRWVWIIAASATAIVSLLSIPAYPFWSLCVFELAIIVDVSSLSHAWLSERR